MNKKIMGLILSASLLIGVGVNAADMAEEVKKNTVEISKAMEVENPNIQLSNLTKITDKGAYTKIFSGLGTMDTTNLWNDLIYLRDNTEIRDVYLYINSGGGSAFDGLAMADWIKVAQNDWGFTFHAHASGLVASAAVPVYASCSERKATEATIFMVHEASLFKFLAKESASDIRAQNELMNLLRHKYIKILVDNSNLTTEDWESKEGSTTWFSADQAREWGLVNSK